MDDDVHLLRVSLLRLRLLQQVAAVGGSLAGTLDDAFVRQVSKLGSAGVGCRCRCNGGLQRRKSRF